MHRRLHLPQSTPATAISLSSMLFATEASNGLEHRTTLDTEHCPTLKRCPDPCYVTRKLAPELSQIPTFCLAGLSCLRMDVLNSIRSCPRKPYWLCAHAHLRTRWRREPSAEPQCRHPPRSRNPVGRQSRGPFANAS